MSCLHPDDIAMLKSTIRGDFWARSIESHCFKSDRLHVVIFQMFLNDLRYVPKIPLQLSVIFLKS